MTPALRFALAALLVAAAAPVAAQNSSAPAEEVIGPPQLRDFTLNGTVTRQAEPPASAQPPRAQPAPAPARNASTQSGAARRDEAPADSRNPRSRTPEIGPDPRASEAARSVTVDLPPAGELDQPAVRVAPIPLDVQPTPSAEAPTPVPPASQPDGAPILPWLIAAALLAAGAAWFVHRRRQTVAPGAFEGEPAAPLKVAPAPPPPATASSDLVTTRALSRPARPEPVPSGFVTTRLRPWLELSFQAGRAAVDAQRGVVEFEVDLFNSGGAPARDILVEAALFNAGPDQEQAIGAFFARPAGRGERVPLIPPLKRMAFRSAVTIGRADLREFEVDGRRLFVPVIGVNVLYRWSGGDAQTSASFLVGRDSRGDKLAPLHVGAEAREFKGLAARELEQRVRR